jgi:hypothetical protein
MKHPSKPFGGSIRVVGALPPPVATVLFGSDESGDAQRGTGGALLSD